jgi:cytochrome c peroxidase
MYKAMVVLVLFAVLLLSNATINATDNTVYTKEALGKKLFSEKILSKDSSVSCASCHKPQFAFADNVAFSFGVDSQEAKRNTPSVLNMKNRPYFFYDGRAKTLEEQALHPIANPEEMALPIEEALQRLNSNKYYVNYFRRVFKQPVTAKNLGAAFAAFEKTLETVDSKFDDWTNDKAKLTAAEERGRQLFVGDKAQCFDCHKREDFTDDSFRNIGLFNGNWLTDSGRYSVTKNNKDLGRFKVPSLRNVAVTAPYMHNGMFASLEEVMRYYNTANGFIPHQQNIDESLKAPLGLTNKEQQDIIAFLKTLTDKRFLKVKKG